MFVCKSVCGSFFGSDVSWWWVVWVVRRAPQMGGCMGLLLPSLFVTSILFLLLRLVFFHLEHCSQSALAMPLAKSFASFPFAIVFLFPQSLPARVLGRTWSGHGHDGISAYGI